ncbi:hypothetical protein LJB42_000948 [Komagataella kurtzmanii]|nr:hypothetical protein LJB42_000948 [Komagataella kurtzmanii]
MSAPLSPLIQQMVSLMEARTNGADPGTGILPRLNSAADMLGGVDRIPRELINYVQGKQLALFGDYPSGKDTAPSAIFMVVFFFIFLAHLTLFGINWSRGHKFLLSFGFAFYALLRVVGFALRLAWSREITRVQVGIASEVFLIIPTILLASFNLILAQRLFTWRHPYVGSSKLFWGALLTVYSVVISVVVMTIVAAVVPYVYLLSHRNYEMSKNVVKVSSILVILYSLLATGLIIVSYLFKPTKRDKGCLIYRPTWLESFSPTYFPLKDSTKQHEQIFIGRNGAAAFASTRIIASSYHYNAQSDVLPEPTAENLKLEPGNEDNLVRYSSSTGQLKHNYSIIIVTLTTTFILIGAVFRAITCFLDRTVETQSWIFKPVVMYMLWGFLETVINVIYLLGRIDLRFYRPDRFPKDMLVGNEAVEPSPVISNKERTSSISERTSNPEIVRTV